LSYTSEKVFKRRSDRINKLPENFSSLPHDLVVKTAGTDDQLLIKRSSRN